MRSHGEVGARAILGGMSMSMSMSMLLRSWRRHRGAASLRILRSLPVSCRAASRYLRQQGRRWGRGHHEDEVQMSAGAGRVVR
jgi:hypothetical protein